MSADLTFSETDFFYNNINAPIKFNPALCTLSDTELRKKITDALNIPDDIKSGTVPTTDQTAGQCTLRKATQEDKSQDQLFKDKFIGKAWKLKYVGQGIKQTCNCIKVNPLEYVASDSNTLSSTTLSGTTLDVDMLCKNSIPVTLTDSRINEIDLDPKKKDELIASTVNYYKAACANKNKSVELIKSNSTNQDSDLKYEDTREFYNREYLNRINLGIGIIATCGFIYYTFISGNEPTFIPPTSST